MAAYSFTPQLLAALQSAFASALDGVEVGRGLRAGISSVDYLGLGVVDPDATRSTASVTSTIDWVTTVQTGGFDETGEVACAALAVRSTDDVATATDAAYAIFDQVVDHLRNNWQPNAILGIPGLWDLHPSSTELVTVQTDAGATAYLLFRLAFQVRTD